MKEVEVPTYYIVDTRRIKIVFKRNFELI